MGATAAPDLHDMGVPTTPEARERYVREMFDGIAHRYDLLNRLLSLWQDVRWRRAAVEAACDGHPVRRVLDVATGTGDLALALHRRLGPSGDVVGVDFALGMMQVARHKAGRSPAAAGLHFAAANALQLPFADGSFDAATMAFAARNVTDLVGCFREMGRVVRPGGRVVCLELSHPAWPGFAALYQFYFYRLVPLIGRVALGRRGPYDYLPRSLTRFPDQEALAGLMRHAGLVRVRYRNLFGGIAALHIGEVAAGGSREA